MNHTVQVQVQHIAGDNKPHIVAAEQAFTVNTNAIPYEGGAGTPPNAHLLVPATGTTELVAVNKNELPGADSTALYEAGVGCHETIEIPVTNNDCVISFPQGEFGPEGIRANFD